MEQFAPLSHSRAIPITKLQINQVLRDRRPKSAVPAVIKGLVNLYAATASAGAKLIPFDAGINSLAPVSTAEGPRRPAILISSSPHKSGSVVTPWQDIFAPDEGYVRYFGDAKTPGQPAQAAPGNAVLVDQFQNHHSHPEQSQRARAVPLIFFQRQQYDGIQKGYPRFQGFGVITAARLVTQHNEASGGAFANYEFECAVLTMKSEAELFDWAWINARRDRELSDEETLADAPEAWKEWIKHGETALPRLRRRVLRRTLTPTDAQMPSHGSPEATILQEIYAHYDGKKIYFESLAAAVAERLIAPSATGYTTHGVTRGSGDFGIDFIAQLDIGQGFSRAPLVVLGQAKCVAPGSQTNARDLARTVARLRRGWLGVFVTTGVITERAQTEVFEDRYPLVMIPGLQVALAVREMLHEQGHAHRDLATLLTHFDQQYEMTPRISDPERLVV
jgi:hypothetical protein